MSQYRKSLAGRPSVLTPEAVRKLVGSLSRGSSVRAACRYAGISHEAYYNHIRSKGQFYDILTKSENSVTERARLAVVDAIANGDAKTSRWYLERKAPEIWGKKRFS